MTYLRGIGRLLQGSFYLFAFIIISLWLYSVEEIKELPDSFRELLREIKKFGEI